MDLPAIRQLQKDAKYASVYGLLEIFLTRRLDAYLEFQTVNSSLLTSYGMFMAWLKLCVSQVLYKLLKFSKTNHNDMFETGISHEECITKMRLMSLGDLASKMQEIPYALVQDTLKVF